MPARLIFMGTPDFAVPSLSALLEQAGPLWGVQAAFTRADRPAGRGQHVGQSPVKRAALAAGVPVHQPGSFRDPAARAKLAELRPDLIVVAAYGLILPQEVLDLPRFGCINVHGSILPRYRGAAPIAAAILAGDRQTGVSIMQMDAGVDTGPVFATAQIPVLPGDTTGTLTPRLALLGANLLVATLPRWIRGKVHPEPQPVEGATYAPRIGKEEGEIDWREPADLIARRVLAYQPWPSAYTFWDGQMLKVLRSRPAAAANGDPPGTVIAGVRGALGVSTGAGTLWLDEVQLAGRKPLPAAAFLAGARGFVGSRLGRE